MSTVRPLSDLTNHLQTLAKVKDGEMFTGSAFIEEYGEPIGSCGRDEEPNRTVATAGGDVQHAYSKVNSVYKTAKEANKQNRNEFKLTGEATQSLNTQALAADLELAVEKLQTAATKLDDHDASVAAELREIADNIDLHRERIENTGMVKLT